MYGQGEREWRGWRWRRGGEVEEGGEGGEVEVEGRWRRLGGAGEMRWR